MINNDIIVPEPAFNRLIARVHELERASMEKDARIANLTTILRECQEKLDRALRTLGSSLQSSRTTYKMVGAASLAVVGGVAGLMTGPAAIAAIPSAMAALGCLEVSATGVGLAIGAVGGGVAGLGAGSLAHNVIHRDQIQEHATLTNQVNTRQGEPRANVTQPTPTAS